MEQQKFTKKEKCTLRKALDLLVDKEEDTIDHTKIYNKLGVFQK